MFLVAVKHRQTGRTAEITSVPQWKIQDAVRYYEHLYRGKLDRYAITVRKER